MQYIGSTFNVGFSMKRLKDETLSIRTSAEVKELLRMAAERERRSIASMIEVLILAYADQHGLKAKDQPQGSVE
jgi:uncharacterized protein (DUF1778 family)